MSDSEEEMYENYTASDANWDIYGTVWQAQTFTPQVDHLITKVRLPLTGRGTASGSFIVSIKATDAGGRPAGPDLVSGSIPASSIAASWSKTWYDISFGSGYALQAGIKYAIVMRAPDQDSGNRCYVWMQRGGDYNGGWLCGSTDGGGAWYDESSQTWDASFEEWGVTGGAPPPINQPPVLDPIGNKTVAQGQLLQFTVSAADPDSDNLTYTASNLPPDASFQPETRTFTWIPAEAGEYKNVHFEVSDGELTDSENITITVNPPIIRYSLTILKGGEGNIIKAPDLEFYDAGSTVNLTAAAAEGWYFSRWSPGVAGVNSANTTVTMNADKIITGYFNGINEEPVSIPDENFLAAVRTALHKPAGGIYPSDMKTVINTGSAFVNKNISFITGIETCTSLNNLDLNTNSIRDIYPLVANEGIGAGDTVNLLNNPLDLSGNSTAMQHINSLKARGANVIHDEPPLMYTLTVGWAGAGGVTKDPDRLYYAPGTRVILTAIPAGGWSFSGWSGNLTGSQTPCTIEVITDMTVNATFTLNSEPQPAPPPSGGIGIGGGGGGGGGGSGDKRITSLMRSITQDGRLLEDIVAESSDAYVSLSLPYGTVCLNRADRFLVSLSIEKVTKVPEGMADTELLGAIYSFLPQGASFSPEIQLKFKYNPSKMPAGIDEEKLTIVRWDDDAGEWLEMETAVDTEKHVFSTFIKHFSYYSYVVKKLPASFEMVDVTVAPEEVEKGQEVLVKAIVSNTGDLKGNCRAVLEVDGEICGEKEVTLLSFQQAVVTFAAVFETSGPHTVSVNGAERIVDVLPSPAVFSLDNFKVTPGTVMPGQDVAVSLTVINSGELSGEYTLECYLDAGNFKTIKLDVPGSSSERVDFTISSPEAGAHHVSINDVLFGEFFVEEAAAAPAPPETVETQAPAVETEAAGPEEKSRSIGTIVFIATGVLLTVAVVAMLAVYRSRRSREL